METLVNLSWRVYLVLPLVILGVILATKGMQRGRSGLLCAMHGDPAQLVVFIKGFRASIWGLTLVGIGAAWLWQLDWLFLISLTIGCGETLETFLILYALKHGSHVSIGTRRARAV